MIRESGLLYDFLNLELIDLLGWPVNTPQGAVCLPLLPNTGATHALSCTGFKWGVGIRTRVLYACSKGTSPAEPLL